MFTVDKAIIMAAGKGERMRPITSTVPKPMISVNGTRMIDTIIDALHENGIEEIYIVVGYLKEKYQELLEKYEGVELIENPYYDSCNNISSLYVAREHLGNCIIMDGDQVIINPRVLQPSAERSGYNAVLTEEHTDEWLMQVDDKGVVAACSRNGGDKGWQLFSVSRWSEEDGAKLRKHLEYEFEEKKNHQIYWDDVAMFEHADEYELGIVEMNPNDVIELDNIDELLAIDSSYSKKIEEYRIEGYRNEK